MSNTRNRFSAEVRARAVRMVMEHQGEHTSRWAAIESIAPKIGCATQTLHNWIKRAEVDDGDRPGVTTDTTAKLKALERENKELRQANEILRKASAYFAHPLGICFAIACRAVSGSSTAHSRDDCFHHSAS